MRTIQPHLPKSNMSLMMTCLVATVAIPIFTLAEPVRLPYPRLLMLTSVVCLSLLNTWTGSPQEMWQPHQSTILGVLVSIQAMILGAPLPWINEPGFNGQGETIQAQEHRLLVQCKTVRYAMLSWLGGRLKPKEAVWQSISQEYWTHHALENVERVREWAQKNEMMKRYDPKSAPVHHHHAGQSAAAQALCNRKTKLPKPPGENLLRRLEQAVLDKFHVGGITPNDPVAADDEEGHDEMTSGTSRPFTKYKQKKFSVGLDKMGYNFTKDVETFNQSVERFLAAYPGSVAVDLNAFLLQVFGRDKLPKKVDAAGGLDGVIEDLIMNEVAALTLPSKMKKSTATPSKGSAKTKSSTKKRTKAEEDGEFLDDMSAAPPTKKVRQDGSRKEASQLDDAQEED